MSINEKMDTSVHKWVIYEIRIFLVLIYPIYSNIEPKPCIQSANINILKLYACRVAKNIITKITDMITDSLRFSENLKNTLKKNTNGINLINSSLINENIDAIIVIMDMELSSTSPPLTIPKFSNNIDMADAYAIYPTKRATARAISLGLGFWNIAL